MAATLVNTLSDRKEEILEAARALFSEMGYVPASMSKIADSLNVKAGSLYSSFKSKEVMLWEIALRCAQAFFDKVAPVAESKLAPAEKLEKMLEAHLEVIIANQDASAIFFEEWKHLEEPHLEEFGQLRDQYEQMFMNVVTEGMDAGQLKTIPKRFLINTLLASANWISRWYKAEGEMNIDQIKSSLIKLFFEGLKTEHE
ncbi:MAG: TetR/AcrR family transcriptional regulator [Bacteroidia bacterium]